MKDKFERLISQSWICKYCGQRGTVTHAARESCPDVMDIVEERHAIASEDCVAANGRKGLVLGQTRVIGGAA